MSRFYYEYNPIDKNNAFTKSKMLKWVMASLDNKQLSVNKGQGIDLLLNHLPVTDVISFYNEIIKSNIIKDNYNKPKLIRNKNAISERAYVILVEFLEEFWTENIKVKIEDELIQEINKLLETNKKLVKKDKINSKLKLLQKTFKLSEDEITALVFCCVINTESDFESLVSERNRRQKNQLKFAHNFSKIIKISQSKAIKIFSKTSSLFKFEFINDDFELNNQLSDYLTGFSDSPFLSSLYKKYSAKPLPLKVHSIRKNDNEIIKNIVLNKETDKGINILLYGIPGTGKTEYVRSIAANLKLNLYEIISHNNITKQRNSYNKPINRFTSFYACQNTIPQDKSVVLIDEADEMLNGKAVGSFFSLFGENIRNTENSLLTQILR